ncbi:protein kinase [Streptomyces anulatus]|uniref:protein kinase domain-containing protein n=1 Tax=Streptomyces globisporus TaxID=1908 RepID=UPI0034602D55
MQQMQPLDSEKDPRVLGTFEILALLGKGGMGRAYLARKLPLDGLAPEWEAAYRLAEPDNDATDGPGLVAVKVIRPDLLKDSDPVLEKEARDRFSTEIDAVRAVLSPRVPALIAAVSEADQPWLAMDFIHGPSLATMISQREPFTVGPYAALGLALVEALRAIHGAGIYHRDLKPGNVVLGPDGPVVLDFGLAVLAERRASQALTGSNASMGTFPYMPLEQLQSTKKVDHAADVYALGATLFFAATGRPPYPFVPLAEPPWWEGVDALFRPLLEEIIVQEPSLRPTLDEVERRLLALLADQGLTAETAAVALRNAVESSGLVPELPAAALTEQGDPQVQEAAQRAVDRGEAPDEPWADGETDLFDMFFDDEDEESNGTAPSYATGPSASPGAAADPQADPTGEAGTHPPTVADQDAQPPATVPSTPTGDGVEEAPGGDPDDAQPATPVTTSYPLHPPAPAVHRVPRGALRVAARLRKDYAHSGRL